MALELHPENNLIISNNLSADGDINTNSRFLSSGKDIGYLFNSLSADKLDKWLSAGYIFVGDNSGIAVPVSADGDVSIGNGGITQIRDGKIFDNHVSEFAQISGIKIVPDFGNQSIITQQGISVQGPILSGGQDIGSMFVHTDLQNGKIWVGNSINQAQAYTITGDVSVGSGGIARIVPYSITNLHVANNAGISGIKIIPNFYSTVNVYGNGINVDGGAYIKQNTTTANLNAQGVYIPEHLVYNFPYPPYMKPAEWIEGDVTARQDIKAGRDVTAGRHMVAQEDIQTFGRFMSGNQELLYVLESRAFLTRTGLNSGQIYIGQPSGGAQAKSIFGEVLLSSTGFTVVAPGVINNSHISSTAAIDGTKIVPSFGNQNITTQSGISVQGPILSGGKELLGLLVDKTDALYLALTGGTIKGPVTIQNGNLVMGPGTHLLSGGLDLSQILESVIAGDYLPTGGGTITGGLVVDQDLTVRGNLIVEGSVSQVNTEVHVTSALSINNSGTGLALEVSQTGSGDVANFYSDESSSILKINQDGKVGINNGTPSHELDVVGTGKFDHIISNTSTFGTISCVELSGVYITALSGLYSLGEASVTNDLSVGHNVAVGNDLRVDGAARISKEVWAEKSLTVGLTGLPVTPDGSLTVAGYISGGSWFTVGSAATTDSHGSIVADGFGKFGGYITTKEGITAANLIKSSGDIQTLSKFLSGDKDLTVVIKEVGDSFFIPLTGCTNTKTVSGDIDLTSGGRYLSGGVDISSLFGASLPVLTNGQTYIGIGSLGSVGSMYLTGGDVSLIDTIGTLNINNEKVTTAHISAGAITDAKVSSEIADRISGLKIVPNFGTQMIDTSGSYMLSGTPLLKILDATYLPITGGTVTGPLSVSLSSDNSALTLKQSGSGSLITAMNSISTVFTVLTSGHVGVNIANPMVSLDVNGTLQATQVRILNGSSSSVFYTSGNRVGINTEMPNVELAVFGSISASDSVYSDKFSTNNLSAVTINVSELTANSANIETFTSTNATLTANTINVSSLSADTLSATIITADEGIFSKLLVTDFSTPVITLSNEDSGKIFHLDTMTTDITAVFPSDLHIGFNIGLVNVGTGTLFISSAQPGFINAYLGLNTNKTLNTGVFAYKHNNGQLYGVGMFNPL